MQVSTSLLLLLLAAVPVLLPGTEGGALPLGSFSGLFSNQKLTTSLKKAETVLVPSLIQSAGLRGLRAIQELPLGDVFFHVNEDTTIELTNLRLSGGQLLELSDITPDLQYMNLRLALDLGTLQVLGNYSVVSRSVLDVLPLTAVGGLSVNMEAVRGEGVVGLGLAEDSLKTQNFDMVYTPRNVFITVTYRTNEGPAVSQVARDSPDHVLVEKFRRELWYRLNLILQRELDGLLESVPVAQLLEDETLLQEYRRHARAVSVVANQYVDDVLEKARQLLAATNNQQLGLPVLQSSFSNVVLGVTWHGSFTANQGWAKNLATIKRTSDVSLWYDSGILTVFGSIGLGELGVGFDNYRAEFMDLGPSGTVRAGVGANSVFIKAAVTVGLNPTAALRELKVEYIENIEIHVTGLGILDWLVSKIATWVVGFFNDQIVGLVDKQLAASVEDILGTINPNEYFL